MPGSTARGTDIYILIRYPQKLAWNEENIHTTMAGMDRRGCVLLPKPLDAASRAASREGDISTLKGGWVGRVHPASLVLK